MNDDLSFSDNLSFSEQFDNDEVDHAIDQISSSLSFNIKDNPLVPSYKASGKLLATFKKRRKEIAKSLENPKLSAQELSDLQLELKVISEVLDQRL